MCHCRRPETGRQRGVYRTRTENPSPCQGIPRTDGGEPVARCNRRAAFSCERTRWFAQSSAKTKTRQWRVYIMYYYRDTCSRRAVCCPARPDGLTRVSLGVSTRRALCPFGRKIVRSPRDDGVAEIDTNRKRTPVRRRGRVRPASTWTRKSPIRQTGHPISACSARFQNPGGQFFLGRGKRQITQSASIRLFIEIKSDPLKKHAFFPPLKRKLLIRSS